MQPVLVLLPWLGSHYVASCKFEKRIHIKSGTCNGTSHGPRGTGVVSSRGPRYEFDFEQGNKNENSY